MLSLLMITFFIFLVTTRPFYRIEGLEGMKIGKAVSTIESIIKEQKNCALKLT